MERTKNPLGREKVCLFGVFLAAMFDRRQQAEAREAAQEKALVCQKKAEEEEYIASTKLHPVVYHSWKNYRSWDVALGQRWMSPSRIPAPTNICGCSVFRCEAALVPNIVIFL